MKKIIPITTLACALCTSIVSAEPIEKPEGWYVKGAAGWFHNLALPGFGGSLGYKKGPWRLEGAYRYQRNHNAYWRLSAYDVGLNGFYDFDNSTIFSPYVGLGIHERFSKTGFNYPDSFTGQYNEINQPYGQAVVGVRAYLSSNLAADLSLGGTFGRHYYHNYSGPMASIGLAYHF